MKKHIIAVFTALILACGVLVGCGQAGGGAAADPHNAAFVGDWELSAIEGEGAISEEDFQLMKDLGLTATLVLFEDGKANLNLFGEDLGEGEWTSTSATEGTLNLEGQDVQLGLDGETLRLSQQGDVLVFTKTAE